MLDTNQNYCNNFYQFVCNPYIKNTSLSAGAIHVDRSTTIKEDVKIQLKSILEKPSESSELESFQLVKNLYKTCLKTNNNNSDRSLDRLKKMVHEAGGWPVLEGENWRSNEFIWKDSILKLFNLGFNIDFLLNMYVDVDLKNSLKRVIYLDKSSLVKNSEGHFSPENETNFTIEIALAMGANPDYAETHLKNVSDFIRKLRDISRSTKKYEVLSNLYNPMTISELTKKFPSIPWSLFIQPGLELDETETIIVKFPKFIEKLELLMIETPKVIQANFIMWKIVEASLRYLHEDIGQKRLQTSSSPQWENCLAIIQEELPISLGALYVRERDFTEDFKNNISEIVMDIRHQFKNILQEVGWIDDETRGIAFEKLASMKILVAHPEELLNDSKILEVYEGLELSDDDDFLDNILRVKLFRRNHSMRQLRSFVDEGGDWEIFDPTGTEPIYSLTDTNIRKLPFFTASVIS